MKQLERLVARECKALRDDLLMAIDDDVAWEQEFELLDGYVVIRYDGDIVVEISHDDVRRHHDDTNLRALILKHLPDAEQERRWNMEERAFRQMFGHTDMRDIRAPW